MDALRKRIVWIEGIPEKERKKLFVRYNASLL